MKDLLSRLGAAVSAVFAESRPMPETDIAIFALLSIAAEINDRLGTSWAPIVVVHMKAMGVTRKDIVEALAIVYGKDPPEVPLTSRGGDA